MRSSQVCGPQKFGESIMLCLRNMSLPSRTQSSPRSLKCSINRTLHIERVSPYACADA